MVKNIPNKWPVLNIVIVICQNFLVPRIIESTPRLLCLFRLQLYTECHCCRFIVLQLIMFKIKISDKIFEFFSKILINPVKWQGERRWKEWWHGMFPKVANKYAKKYDWVWISKTSLRLNLSNLLRGNYYCRLDLLDSFSYNVSWFQLEKNNNFNITWARDN